MRRRPALVCFALTIAAPTLVVAQTNPVVRTALRLAAEGHGDSAYRMVTAELARVHPGDSTYIEALFYRARLATWGDSAERDLRRVAIEYSSSPWADDALLQLSQLALAAGNPASAYDLAGRVRSDYPGSELKPRAALWAARAAFEVGEPRAACALLDTARTEAAADVEFVNQVMFYRARCTASLLSAPPRESTNAALPAPAGVSLQRFEVQVAAASTAQAARTVLDRLGRAGLRAHVVAGEDHLHRVRLGPFPTQAAADSSVRAAQQVVGGAPFVVRVP